MKKIKLTKGFYATVDDEDFEWLSQWSWCFTNGYALRATNRGERFYMHRVINKTPKGLETDHINRDRLDNRRSNLRTVTRIQNSRNHGAHKHNSTGIRGVVWRKNERMYCAQIGVNKKKISLGYFHDINLAIEARRKAEIYYGF
jgi:hypothetical protein